MVTFGLVTEGHTDQVVIENILNGYFNTHDIETKKLQPLWDATDKSRIESYGGWTLVFGYCKSEIFRNAFLFQDYIIIQIDTDVSEEKHYDISKRDKNGKELTPSELIQKVTEKFRGLIGEEFFDANKDKIIFAISVDSIECWLLPIYYKDKKKSKITNCLGTLNRELQNGEKRKNGKREKKGFTIGKKGHSDYYERVSKFYCEKKNLMKCYKENPSLKIFIQELEKRDIVIEDEEDF